MGLPSARSLLDLVGMDIDQERPRLSHSVSQDEQAPLITIIHSVKGELDPLHFCALLRLTQLCSCITVNAVHRLWSNSLSEVSVTMLCCPLIAVSLLNRFLFAQEANLVRFGEAVHVHGHEYTFRITFKGPVCKRT